MRAPLLDPDVADEAPTSSILTGYDEERLLTYIRLLDAATEDADWREVAKIVLHIDPAKEPERAFRAWETHLARARWMTTNGYRYLLAGGAPQKLMALCTRFRPTGAIPPQWNISGFG